MEQPSRLPTPPPIDGDDGSCLEKLMEALNAAWNTFDLDWKAATNDEGRVLAWFAYLAAYTAACSAYYSCCGVIPPA